MTIYPNLDGYIPKISVDRELYYQESSFWHLFCWITCILSIGLLLVAELQLSRILSRSVTFSDSQSLYCGNLCCTPGASTLGRWPSLGTLSCPHLWLIVYWEMSWMNVTHIAKASMIWSNWQWWRWGGLSPAGGLSYDFWIGRFINFTGCPPALSQSLSPHWQF